jgi:hypothetical protein
MLFLTWAAIRIAIDLKSRIQVIAFRKHREVNGSSYLVTFSNAKGFRNCLSQSKFLSTGLIPASPYPDAVPENPYTLRILPIVNTHSC